MPCFPGWVGDSTCWGSAWLMWSVSGKSKMWSVTGPHLAQLAGLQVGVRMNIQQLKLFYQIKLTGHSSVLWTILSEMLFMYKIHTDGQSLVIEGLSDCCLAWSLESLVLWGLGSVSRITNEDISVTEFFQLSKYLSYKWWGRVGVETSKTTIWIAEHTTRISQRFVVSKVLVLVLVLDWKVLVLTW